MIALFYKRGSILIPVCYFNTYHDFKYFLLQNNFSSDFVESLDWSASPVSPLGQVKILPFVAHIIDNYESLDSREIDFIHEKFLENNKDLVL